MQAALKIPTTTEELLRKQIQLDLNRWWAEMVNSIVMADEQVQDG